MEAPCEFADGSIFYRAVDVKSRFFEAEGGYGGRAAGMWIVAALSVLALEALICAVVTFSIAAQSISGVMGPAVEARVLDVEDGATLGRCVYPRTHTVGWAQHDVDHIESFVECSKLPQFLGSSCGGAGETGKLRNFIHGASPSRCGGVSCVRR